MSEKLEAPQGEGGPGLAIHRAAMEAARYELVTLDGLLAADGAAPGETWTINVRAVIRQLDKALSATCENGMAHS